MTRLEARALCSERLKKMKLNEPYWRWSADGTVCYVEYMYETRFLKRIKTKRLAMFFASDWPEPADARGAAEDFIDRIKK